MPAKPPAAPSRRRRLCRFEHVELDLVWAAIETLDPALQEIVLRELAAENAALLARARGPKAPWQKIRVAVAALWDAHDIYGHSPSIPEYRELRKALPELALPPDSNIRKWLGGGWNHCLRRALLPEVSDGDFTTLPLDHEFGKEELLDVLRACAAELRRVPRVGDLMAWVRDPEVAARHERLPLSVGPFYRHGGYCELLVEAGVTDEAGAMINAAGRIVPAKHAWTREDRIGALREVAKSLGRSPRMDEFKSKRREIQDESIRAGKPRAMPSAHCIRDFFGSWDKGLVEAGLEPLGGRGTYSNWRPRRPTYTPEQKDATLLDAWVELGQPFVEERFKRWRDKRISAAEKRGEVLHIPGAEVIKALYGGWREACFAVIPGYRPPGRRWLKRPPDE